MFYGPRGQLLYEGKSKRVWATGDPDSLPRIPDSGQCPESGNHPSSRLTAAIITSRGARVPGKKRSKA